MAGYVPAQWGPTNTFDASTGLKTEAGHLTSVCHLSMRPVKKWSLIYSEKCTCKRN